MTNFQISILGEVTNSAFIILGIGIDFHGLNVFFLSIKFNCFFHKISLILPYTNTKNNKNSLFFFENSRVNLDYFTIQNASIQILDKIIRLLNCQANILNFFIQNTFTYNSVILLASDSQISLENLIIMYIICFFKEIIKIYQIATQVSLFQNFKIFQLFL